MLITYINEALLDTGLAKTNIKRIIDGVQTLIAISYSILRNKIRLKEKVKVVWTQIRQNMMEQCNRVEAAHEDRSGQR